MVKFDNLRKQIFGINEKPGEVNLRPSWVVNLSNHKLSTTEEVFLAKGPKYFVTPKINPIDIAAPIEAALQISSATDQDKELARVKICEAVRKAKKPANNIYSGGAKGISRAEERIGTPKFFTLTKRILPCSECCRLRQEST